MADMTKMQEATRQLAEACRDAAAVIADVVAVYDRWRASLTPAELAEWNRLAFPIGGPDHGDLPPADPALAQRMLEERQ